MDEIDKIIDAIILAEVGNKPNGGYTNDPHDAGGRTQWGIAERSNPEAWLDNKVTEEEARAIYRKRYVDGPGFSGITDRHLQHFLVDWGVISGPAIAIQHLQRTLGVQADGTLGAVTLAAANNADPRALVNRLVIARVKMIGQIIHRRPSQVQWINGWLNRALEFFVV